MLSPRPRRRPRRLQENFARFTNRLALNASWRLGTEPLRPGEKAFTNLLERFRRAKGCPRKVPGGTVDPGKVLAGLARAAESAGAQIAEHAEVRALDFSNPVRLRVRYNRRGRIHRKEIRTEQVLLATNAFSLELSGLRAAAEPKLTFALATAPLSAAQLKALGLSSPRPFYTVDLPYLWGRLLESNGFIFGAALVPPYVGAPSRVPFHSTSIKNRTHDLRRNHVPNGDAAARLRC